MKISRKLGLSLSIPTVLFAGTGLAEDATESITITAHRMPVESIKSIAAQVIISREDIEKIQPNSISELLTTVAGFGIADSGGRGQQGAVFIRGTNSNHVLVLVDGVRVGSATLGSTNLQTISPSIVERIEIVKGPRSALWGSDAIGGVIHIFTRKFVAEKGKLALQYGADNYQSYSASIGMSHGDGSTTVTINKESADGINAIEGADTDADGFDSRSIALKGDQKLSEAVAIDWLVNYQENDNEYDSLFGGADQRQQVFHVWKTNLYYQWQQGSTAHTSSISLSQNRDSSTDFQNSPDEAFAAKFETRRDQVSLLNQSIISDNFKTIIGVDLYEEKVSGTTDYDQDQRSVNAIFAHSLYQTDKLVAELALRHDDVENIESETTYNLSASLQVTDNVQLALLKGTGFKTPSFNDLYYPADPFSSGNPNLQSEKSDTLEFAISANFSAFSLELSVYQTDIENLVQWIPDENFFYSPENLAEAEIEGADLSAKFEGWGGTHQFNYSYLDAIDPNAAAGSEKLIRRADNQFNYSFAKQIGAAELYLEYQYVGDREDVSFPSRVTLDSYQLFNAALTYPLSEDLNAKLKMHNLFDEDYQTIVNYNTAGRSVYLALDYNW